MNGKIAVASVIHGFFYGFQLFSCVRTEIASVFGVILVEADAFFYAICQCFVLLRYPEIIGFFLVFLIVVHLKNSAVLCKNKITGIIYAAPGNAIRNIINKG